jgi:hypothetical protein
VPERVTIPQPDAKSARLVRAGKDQANGSDTVSGTHKVLVPSDASRSSAPL